MILLTLAGFFIGILVSILGGGGGLAYVGILTTFFGIAPEIAATTSVATIIPTALAGTISHTKQGNIRFKLFLQMLPSGIAGVILGTAMGHGINPETGKKIFGAFLLAMGLFMAVKYFRSGRENSDNNKQMDNNRTAFLKMIFFGFLAGLTSGIFGLSGTAPLLIGLMSVGCTSLEVVGTSLIIILGLSVTSVLSHITVGAIDFRLMGWLLGGTVPGAVIAPLLLKVIRKEHIEKIGTPILLILILISSLMLLIK